MSGYDPVKIKSFIESCFSLDQLDRFCYDRLRHLQVSGLDDLAGERIISGKALALVRRAEKGGWLEDLVGALRQEVPRRASELDTAILELEDEQPAPPASDATSPPDQSGTMKPQPRASLSRQLDEIFENLRLIQERKTEYVMDVDIPLQLIKQERQLRAKIVELMAQIAVIEAVLVPAGDFFMGSDPYDRQAEGNEKPMHRIHLPAYEIAKYPVTNAQYWAFVQSSEYPPPKHWIAGEVPAEKEEHPVVNVSLEDARAFCRWLTRSTGQPYRLPTEAEWEKAARGAWPEKWRYPWGDEWQHGAANTKELGDDSIKEIRDSDTTPVKAFETKNKSPFGVVDMAGNVLEWTTSRYQPYPGSDYQSGDTATRYVVRGGSHTLPHDCARVSWRGRYDPDASRPYLGFRVVLEVK